MQLDPFYYTIEVIKPKWAIKQLNIKGKYQWHNIGIVSKYSKAAGGRVAVKWVGDEAPLWFDIAQVEKVQA